MSETVMQFNESKGAVTRSYADLSKRIFDVAIAFLGMLILSPIFFWLTFRIKKDSPGPIFYRGARMGRNGKIFSILKFRTMHERPETYAGPRVTAHDDPRITSLGKWLRDTKLNELPQLWNVLVGEMSLVGPRPEDPEITKDWSEDIRRELLSVRPGITSPASVMFRNEETLLKSSQVMSTYLEAILPSKIRLDQLYVRNRSFWLDLDTIFWTALVLLPKLGKYKPPEMLLFVGPATRLGMRYLNWFTLDTVVSFTAMAVAGLIWRSLGPLDQGWLRAAGLAFGFACLYSAVGAILGVNRIAWSRAGAMESYDLLPAVIVATLLALGLNALLPLMRPDVEIPPLPAGMIVLASVLAFGGFVLVRYRTRLITGFATRWLARSNRTLAGRERVLIVGGGETGQFAAWLLTSSYYAGGFQVVGFVDDDMYKQGVRIRGVNVLGQRGDIPDLVKKHDIGLIVFAIHNIARSERQQVLDICTSSGARTVLLPDIPAALNALIGMNGHGNGHGNDSAAAGQGEWPQGRVDGGALPCHLCLTKVSPMKVDGWLAGLEATAAGGDLEAVRAELAMLRQQVRGDVAVQRKANED